VKFLKPLEILKHYYGYDEFRPGQKEIITSIMMQRDTMAIMPTGSGKSLCFQIPALLLDGKSIVVSPLISLMKDQVDSLKAMDIEASFINSSLSYEEIYKRTEDFINDKYKILYVAPERLGSFYFSEDIYNSNISQIAVDEAHCVSEWGHDFRPSYQNISEFVKRFRKRPVVSAFTATATKNVRKDIEKLLELEKPEIFNLGLRRSNIYIEILKGENRKNFILNLLQKRPDDAGIIYCATRKSVEEYYDFLLKKGYNIGKYHGGMEPLERKEMQDAFILEDINLMIATNAFGMGIDKPNIRYIVHLNMPKTIEAYYQEIGRAGRDGENSQAYMLFSEADKNIQRFLIEKSDLSEERTLVAGKKLQDMINFCHTHDCLWNYISTYFNEENEEKCENCFNCLNTAIKQYDITVEAQKILSCVYRLKQSYGSLMVAKVLMGSNSSKIKQKGFDKLSTFGIMSEFKEKEIKDLINFLTAERLLNVSPGRFPLLGLNKDSWMVLRGEKKVLRKTSMIITTDKEPNEELFHRLRKLRKTISESQNVPPYVVFPDYTLKEMSSIKPANEVEMLRIKGVGEKKLEKYGALFISEIKEYEGTND
jgi:ATP-dependent DNA helicase RecQ